MKIGIITQPFHSNYGGILQNYALQQVLMRMEHEVWTIDYRRFNWIDWFDSAWRIVAHKVLGHDVHFANIPPVFKLREMPLRRFVDKYISLTKPRIKYLNSKIIKKYAFDAIVVGSDQVWRPCYNYNVADCFLRFAAGCSVRRLAYAASFGTKEWEFTDAQSVECAQLAKRFDGISVREKSGVELCKKHLGVDAVHVLDPTLLLHAVDYVELCKDIPKRESFVFAYILDKSDEKLKQIKDFAKRKGIDYLIKSADFTVGLDDTVELWLSYFRDAAFVITDSFHGTAFSINFNKDFYVFGNAERGNSRFDSLLGQLGLESRMINGKIPAQTQSIDWAQVNCLRKSAVHYAEAWLKQALIGENERICQK